jgi:putative transposase
MTSEFERTFFVTTVCENRRPIFRNRDIACLMMDTLSRYQTEGKFILPVFVIMPDHLHLLIVPNERVSLEKAIQFIKGGFSYRFGKIAKGVEVWQRSFTHERVKDEADFQRYRDYIVNNPVRAKLVTHPAAYPYSSAYSAAAKAGSGS